MSRRFVIPDIHGCCRTFRRLVSEVIRLERADELYLLGDMIDRGPDSKGVLDFILELRDQGFSIKGVKGNHEEMCLRAGEGLEFMELWILNGGLATLRSFAAENANEIPRRYRNLLRSLPDYILLDDFVIVHAALNFDRSDPFADIEAMLCPSAGPKSLEASRAAGVAISATLRRLRRPPSSRAAWCRASCSASRPARSPSRSMPRRWSLQRSVGRRMRPRLRN